MGGGLITNTTGLVLGENSNAGNFFLNGGVVQANSVTTFENSSATAVGSLYFNGGTLQASASRSNYFTQTNSFIQAGGAIIDTNGFSISASNSFVPDPALIGTDGGLTVLGGGTLTLSGASTYMGGSRVENATLIVTNPAAIEDGTNLYVGPAGSFFAPVVPSPASSAVVAPVPEPGTLVLLAAGVFAIAAAVRRKQRSVN